MYKIKHLFFLIVISTIFIFSILGFVGCENENPGLPTTSTTIGSTSTTVQINTTSTTIDYTSTTVQITTTTINTTIDPNIKGTFENSNVKIVITDLAVVIIDNLGNVTIYNLVSSNDNKIIVKDESGINIEIVISSDKITIGDTVYDDLVKDPEPTTTTTTTIIIITTTTIVVEPIYVSTAGNDDNDGKSLTPVKTISKAITLVNNSENIIRNTIYIATGTYNELINITSTIPINIKGGYTISGSNWTRANSNDKSIITTKIGGDGTLPDNTGRITISENSKAVLENINIKGGAVAGAFDGRDPTIHYTEIYGIVNNGDLTIDNCYIVAIESGNINTLTATDRVAGTVYGLRNFGNSVILSGEIIGSAGNAETKNSSAIFNVGTLTIKNGTLIGITNDATSSNWASGVESFGGTVTIIDGIITGVTGNSDSPSGAAGVNAHDNANIIIKGGTITALTGNANRNWVAAVNYDDNVDTITNATPKFTISGGIITGSKGRDVLWEAIGVRNKKGNTRISGGTIVGIENGTVKDGGAKGIKVDGVGGIANISGGTITAATGSAKANDAQGIENGGGVIIVVSGTITAATDSVEIKYDVIGINTWNGTTYVRGGTITGATNGVKATKVHAIINNDNCLTNITDGIIRAVSGSISDLEWAKGVYNSGTLNILGGTITGVLGNNNLEWIHGIHNKNKGNVSIAGGTIIGASGTITAERVYGIVNDSTGSIDLSGGVITGATGNVTISERVYGIENFRGRADIKGGTITGLSSGVGEKVYAIFNNDGNDISITGGIIIGGAGNANIKNVYGIFNQYIVGISNCKIYGRESTVTANTCSAIYKDGTTSKILKGSKTSTIQDIKGTGPNLWDTYSAVSKFVFFQDGFTSNDPIYVVIPKIMTPQLDDLYLFGDEDPLTEIRDTYYPTSTIGSASGVPGESSVKTLIMEKGDRNPLTLEYGDCFWIKIPGNLSKYTRDGWLFSPYNGLRMEFVNRAEPDDWDNSRISFVSTITDKCSAYMPYSKTEFIADPYAPTKDDHEQYYKLCLNFDNAAGWYVIPDTD